MLEVQSGIVNLLASVICLSPYILGRVARREEGVTDGAVDRFEVARLLALEAYSGDNECIRSDDSFEPVLAQFARESAEPATGKYEQHGET